MLLHYLQATTHLKQLNPAAVALIKKKKAKRRADRDIQHLPLNPRTAATKRRRLYRWTVMKSCTDQPVVCLCVCVCVSEPLCYCHIVNPWEITSYPTHPFSSPQHILLLEECGGAVGEHPPSASPSCCHGHPASTTARIAIQRSARRSAQHVSATSKGQRVRVKCPRTNGATLEPLWFIRTQAGSIIVSLQRIDALVC